MPCQTLRCDLARLADANQSGRAISYGGSGSLRSIGRPWPMAGFPLKKRGQGRSQTADLPLFREIGRLCEEMGVLPSTRVPTATQMSITVSTISAPTTSTTPIRMMATASRTRTSRTTALYRTNWIRRGRSRGTSPPQSGFGNRVQGSSHLRSYAVPSACPNQSMPAGSTGHAGGGTGRPQNERADDDGGHQAAARA
jgi:hypothetical protein